MEKVVKKNGDKVNILTTENKDARSYENFRIRIELDPMSIALFTLAVVTRFFRLSEPRNVV